MNKSLATTITQLEKERARLLRDLDAVESRLRAVGQALGKGGSATGSRASAGRSNGAGAKKPLRRAWFERDEAAELLKKAAKKPSVPADLVRELAKMKGYAGRLAKQDLRRFQGAAFMAISQALKTGALKRQGREGMLVAG
jgi:hypothetical protein